jgi:hypothetical protein
MSSSISGVNRDAVAQQFVVTSLFGSCVTQQWEPFERHRERAPVLEMDHEGIGNKFDRSGSGRGWPSDRSSHSTAR